MSLYLSIFCLECACFVLRAANMYVFLNLSRWVMPLSEPRYLHFAVRKLQGEAGKGHVQSIKNKGIPWGTS